MTQHQDPIAPLIKSGYARILLELFREYHQDAHAVIEESGLPAGLFDLDQEFVPQAPVKKLIYLLGNQLGMTQFNELLKTAIRQKAIPRLISEFSHCATIRQALELTKQVYQYDSTTANVGLETQHGRTWYWCMRHYEDSLPFVWSEVYAVMYIIELVRTMTKTDWQPKQIKVQSNDIALHQAMIGHSPQYMVSNHRIEVLIEEHILDMTPNITKDDSAKKPPLVTWHSNFTDRVFTALLPYIKQQDVTLEYAAGLLKMSPRTLQRRLKEEKTNFRNIKDNLVFTAAVEMMEQEQTLTHISTQLGFSDIAHFSRAFKRISGFTPKVYRRTVLNLST
ncbi:helix-turn-helix domain-containing protein [Vibrio agarivorans]|uniref:Helix-turn-helix transcriptional regulator n=1 Tax=Vibrio agarivorans TaxID=153622 RepID=A0ABT7XZT5_9VIBR|nr:helix-turn-helix transcriptional regulator [Vibrio agarivorans]MDN2481299.1 helix-turn-helix transcriptional regulator [Vibrio agarivorans]